MRKLLILTILLACAISLNVRELQAVDVCLVSKNPATDAGKGADSLLYNAMVNVLGYTVTWFDVDNIGASFTSAYFDTNFDAVIILGATVSEVLPTSAASAIGDTITNANVGVLCLSSNGWHAVNLATGRAVTNYTNASPANLGRSNFATKVLADTLYLWGSNSVQAYEAIVADTGMGQVKSLLVHSSDLDDTSRSWMQYADSGATLVNTGDGRTEAKGRRMLLLPWNYTEQVIDSCQWYTLFLRSVALVVGDSLNAGLYNNNCLSGPLEFIDSWSGGSEPAGIYNAYTALANYQGWDFDAKVTFWKIDSLALERKFASIYRSATASSVKLKERIQGFAVEYEPSTVDSNWECHIAYLPSRRPLKITNFNAGVNVASNTYPNANYYWAQIDTAGGITTGDTLLWTVQPPGKDSTNDVFWEPSDIAQWSRAASAVGDYHTFTLNASRWTGFLLDPSLQTGYLSKTVYSNQSTYSPPGVEVQPYSSNSATSTVNRPVVTVGLSSYSLTLPVPEIAIQYDSLVYTATEGGSGPAVQTNVISNSAGGALVCQSFSDDVAWLSLASYDEGTPYTIYNTVSLGSLTAGYYFGTVTIQCDDASNSPQTYKVAFTVNAAETPAPAASVEKRTGLRKP